MERLIVKFLTALFRKRLHPKHPKTDFLYGFDLTEWDYIGYSTIEFRSDGVLVYSAAVHFFLGSSDDSLRDFHVESAFADKFYEEHVWMNKVNLWHACMIDPYCVVETWPSQHLRTIKAAQGLTWTEKGWAGETAAVTSANGNVITVDFNK